MAHESSYIDTKRLFEDLQLTDEHLSQIAALGIDDHPYVTSKSAIKGNVLESSLSLVCAGKNFAAVGTEADSNVGEQPLGGDTIDGSLNRLSSVLSSNQDGTWFSIENGLFRVPRRPVPIIPSLKTKELFRFPEDADLTRTYDPTAQYEDRAVVAIRIPGYPVVIQVSPSSEAVRFPKDIVEQTSRLPGGFLHHTVGSLLKAKGIVHDKQNPHIDLTTDRPGGPLSRQDQIARVIIRGLLRLTDVH
ncbi:MAG TPA: DUF84 family protein [Candidatus Saccharimonadales bacterium]